VSGVLDYIKYKGIVDESCFNYQGNDQIECSKYISECKKVEVLDYCVASNVESIKREIFKNGPVIASIIPYRDFLLYD
jgi:hypothetical protein